MENIQKVYSAATLINRDFVESQLEYFRMGSIDRFQFEMVLGERFKVNRYLVLFQLCINA